LKLRPSLFLPGLIDHKISQCWKILPSLFSLALLAKFYFAAKTIGLLYWYKTPILKQPHPLLHSLAQALQLTHNSKRHTIPYD
jgi:hypothetical protein